MIILSSIRHPLLVQSHSNHFLFHSTSNIYSICIFYRCCHIEIPLRSRFQLWSQLISRNMGKSNHQFHQLLLEYLEKNFQPLVQITFSHNSSESHLIVQTLQHNDDENKNNNHTTTNNSSVVLKIKIYHHNKPNGDNNDNTTPTTTFLDKELSILKELGSHDNIIPLLNSFQVFDYASILVFPYIQSTTQVISKQSPNVIRKLMNQLLQV